MARIATNAMNTAAEMFQEAVRLHQSGQLAPAEQIYRKLWALNPREPAVLHLLGLVCHQTGRHQDAIALITQAIAIHDRQPTFHSNLGEAYRALGQHAQALHCYEKAIQLSGSFVPARYNLGLVLQALGDLAAAERSYLEVIRVEPRHVDAHNNLGNVLRAQKRLDEAQACYRQALAIDPSRAQTLSNLGAVLIDLKRFDEAIATVRQACHLDPASADAHFNLGNALKELRRRDEAADCYRKALQRRPDFPRARTNLGMVFHEQGELEDAVAELRHVLEMHPEFVEAHNNLGVVYQQLGRFAEARGCFEEALRLRGDFGDAHHSLGVLNLMQGDFEAGWRESEWRTLAVAGHRPPLPAWQGEPLAEGRILLVAEGGLGDTWQFIRYLPWVQERAREVIVIVQPGAVALLQSAGLKNIFGPGADIPPCDVHALFFSLPFIFQTRVDTVPASVPYLWPDQGLVESWKARLATFRGFRIGINWQGNPEYACDSLRSAPLEWFEPLAKVPGVELIRLQQRDGLEQLPGAREKFTIHEVPGEVDTANGAFMDTAAIMRNLDLVVTSDTSTAHLAGALGVNTWIALSSAAEWRWLVDREDSPWYPTMRLFRQTKLKDWSTVFERMAAALPGEIARREQADG